VVRALVLVTSSLSLTFESSWVQTISWDYARWGALYGFGVYLIGVSIQSGHTLEGIPVIKEKNFKKGLFYVRSCYSVLVCHDLLLIFISWLARCFFFFFGVRVCVCTESFFLVFFLYFLPYTFNDILVTY
jgi:hypothetical protein